MAKKITVEELSNQLSKVSRGQLLRELHVIALDYAAKGQTMAAMLVSTQLNHNSGRLAGSIAGRVVKGKGYIGVKLSAGGGKEDVKYAAVHEYGATGSNAITPKKARYLTVPVHKELKTASRVGRVPSARDVPGLTFAQNQEGEKMLVHEVTGEVWYMLRRRVEIEANPYLRPSIEYIEGRMMPEVSRVLRGVL
jgi:hypothetical protein